MSKYDSINEFPEILGVPVRILRNWDKKGKLHPHHTSSNEYRYYLHEQWKRANKAKNMIKELIEDDKDIKDHADSK